MPKSPLHNFLNLLMSASGNAPEVGRDDEEEKKKKKKSPLVTVAAGPALEAENEDLPRRGTGKAYGPATKPKNRPKMGEDVEDADAYYWVKEHILNVDREMEDVQKNRVRRPEKPDVRTPKIPPKPDRLRNYRQSNNVIDRQTGITAGAGMKARVKK